MKNTWLCTMALLFSLSAQAQYFTFNPVDSVPVQKNSSLLQNPWYGGLDFAQPAHVDLNGDGILDLVVFDRTGNRWITFKNNGISDSLSYTLFSEGARKLPNLQEWVLWADFNCDGLPDIFSYFNGGVQVYKNQNQQFIKFKNQLISNYNPNVLPLYVSLADIPAITDVDNDTDLDILTFNVTGGCVEWHKNMSIERYGHCDSLEFEMVTDNWGHFVEGASAADISLNDSCDAQRPVPESEGTRHTGSSLAMFDLNNDTFKDLILGDIGGTSLTALIRNGAAQPAIIQTVDTQFPQNYSNTQPAQITLFPAAFFHDFTNDGVTDLVVAPNAPGTSETAASTWLYKNRGTNTQPRFQLSTTNWLQGDGIELGQGAFPAWVDVNQDGLIDLVIGNQSYWNGVGQLALLLNTGNGFDLVSSDFANISAFNFTSVVPAFADLDADGDMDMVLGETTGYLHYFENIAPAGQMAQFAAPIQQWMAIKENSYSAPAFADLNNDSLIDLVCGSRLGRLQFYPNQGSAQNPQFSSVPSITNFGNVNVVDFTVSASGYSVPNFFKVSGKWELMVGAYNGKVYHFSDISINQPFRLVTDTTLSFNSGLRAAVAIADLNQDGLVDAVRGNLSGGVSLFWGTQNQLSQPPVESEVDVLIYPNPVIYDLYFNKPAQQLAVYNVQGQLVFEHAGALSYLNLAQLKPGVYFLRGETTSGTIFWHKFVKA